MANETQTSSITEQIDAALSDYRTAEKEGKTANLVEGLEKLKNDISEIEIDTNNPEHVRILTNTKNILNDVIQEQKGLNFMTQSTGGRIIPELVKVAEEKMNNHKQDIENGLNSIKTNITVLSTAAIPDKETPKNDKKEYDKKIDPALLAENNEDDVSTTAANDQQQILALFSAIFSMFTGKPLPDNFANILGAKPKDPASGTQQTPFQGPTTANFLKNIDRTPPKPGDRIKNGAVSGLTELQDHMKEDHPQAAEALNTIITEYRQGNMSDEALANNLQKMADVYPNLITSVDTSNNWKGGRMSHSFSGVLEDVAKQLKDGKDDINVSFHYNIPTYRPQPDIHWKKPDNGSDDYAFDSINTKYQHDPLIAIMGDKITGMLNDKIDDTTAEDKKLLKDFRDDFAEAISDYKNNYLTNAGLTDKINDLAERHPEAVKLLQADPEFGKDLIEIIHPLQNIYIDDHSAVLYRDDPGSLYPSDISTTWSNNPDYKDINIPNENITNLLDIVIDNMNNRNVDPYSINQFISIRDSYASGVIADNQLKGIMEKLSHDNPDLQSEFSDFDPVSLTQNNSTATMPVTKVTDQIETVIAQDPSLWDSTVDTLKDISEAPGVNIATGAVKGAWDGLSNTASFIGDLFGLGDDSTPKENVTYDTPLIKAKAPESTRDATSGKLSNAFTSGVRDGHSAFENGAGRVDLNKTVTPSQENEDTLDKKDPIAFPGLSNQLSA